jgi:carbon monoxide dehydrogenase subunit G
VTGLPSVGHPKTFWQSSETQPDQTMPKVQQDFNYVFDIAAPPRRVWAFLWDVQAMAGCIPGCEEVISRDENRAFLAKIRRKVGPFLIRMDLDVEVTECVEPERATMVITGLDKKLRSNLSQKLDFSLNGEPEGPSRIVMDTHFQLNGVLAALGTHLLRGHIRREMDNYVANVHRGIESCGSEAAS